MREKKAQKDAGGAWLWINSLALSLMLASLVVWQTLPTVFLSFILEDKRIERETLARSPARLASKIQIQAVDSAELRVCPRSTSKLRTLKGGGFWSGFSVHDHGSGFYPASEVIVKAEVSVVVVLLGSSWKTKIFLNELWQRHLGGVITEQATDPSPALLNMFRTTTPYSIKSYKELNRGR